MKRGDFEELPSVARWLRRLSYKRSYTYSLMRFCFWLRDKGEVWVPDDLVGLQRGLGGDDRFRVLDLLQEYVLGLGTRYNSKRADYAAVRSFFMHNRCDLPSDKSFKVKSDLMRVEGRLTVDDLRQVVLRSNSMYQAIFLSMFGGGMGLGELVYWSDNGFESLLSQLDRRVHPVKVSLPGRKQGRGKKPFYTYLSSDANRAVRKYLEEHPHVDGTVFINQYGEPVNRSCIQLYWIRQLRALGILGENQKGKGNRYGRNPHEMRDLFRTRWEMSGAPSAGAEFMMGHIVDDLGYNKAYENVDFMTQAYCKAEDWLNILSKEPEKVPLAKMEQEIYKIRAEQDERIAKLEEYMRLEQEAKRIKERLGNLI